MVAAYEAGQLPICPFHADPDSQSQFTAFLLRIPFNDTLPDLFSAKYAKSSHHELSRVQWVPLEEVHRRFIPPSSIFFFLSLHSLTPRSPFLVLFFSLFL